MRLALGLGDIFEIGIGDPRLLEHRPGNGNVVVLGERRHHAVRRIGHRRKPARQLGQRFGLDLLDQGADDVVEQRDVFVAVAARAVEKETGDATQRLGPLFRGAVLDDLFQFGKQRGGNAHCEILRKRLLEVARSCEFTHF